ncbi:MAG TPA: hypothetical protein DER09_02080 [Prolixibacteraceae bacterium]|nr:hypothetical protein [Prolixibacteraceae bacterium]
MAKISGYRNILINAGIIVLFIVLAYAYFSPLLEGKELQMSDLEHFKGMSKELVEHRNSTGEEAVWTNTMFSGMPGYMISVIYPGNLADYPAGLLRNLFSIASFIIWYFLGFYILLSSLKLNQWIRVAGAIGFGFSSYFIIIIGAGHATKAMALGFLPLLIAGMIMTFRGKKLPGAILFATGLAFELLANHLQITYYGMILMGMYTLAELVAAIREKAITAFGKSVLFLVAGIIIAVGMNFSRLYTAWEYSKETIRGPSELTSTDANKTTGLDKDYVVQWSYGIDETLTLLIPNFKGGSSLTNPGENSESFKTMQQKGVQSPKQAIRGVSMYHGEQPFTSGPVYVGAIVVFLFVLGLFVVKGVYKWWLAAATVVSIILSWGGNVMGLTSFLLDYLPLYNKFRAPSMTLVIAQIAMPLLGFIALNEILSGKVDKKIWLNGLKWSAGITGGIALVFALLPGIAGEFSNVADPQRFPDWLIDSVVADRKSLLRMDAFRSLVFIALAAGALYAWNLKKLNATLFTAILGVLILVDLWSVDKRYLNNDNFVSKREATNPFPEMPVDKAILQDKDLYYRVLPLQNPFQDARASYFHKNVGGYHAAKLRRYQEMIDNHLIPEIQELIQGLQAETHPDSVFAGLGAINMLNTRYLIYDLNQPPIKNNAALGNAWTVSKFQLVENADEEIETIKNINPAKEVVIDKRFAQNVNGISLTHDSIAQIVLTEYQPNYLKYSAKSSSEQIAVFSEVYYAKGWKAYIDGQEVPHFRVNYILRSLILPAGDHTIEFKFHPTSYYTGNKISLASSLLLLLAILGYAFSEYRKRRTTIN